MALAVAVASYIHQLCVPAVHQHQPQSSIKHHKNIKTRGVSSRPPTNTNKPLLLA